MTTPPHPSVAFVASKGGVGCSTVAACYALRLSHDHPVHLVSHDAGSMLALLGLDRASHPESTTQVSERLTVGPLGSHVEGAAVVCDAGLEALVAATYDRSFLVMRACYLAIRRAIELPFRPESVVLVREQGRALGKRDVEEATGLPVALILDYDPAVARAVDAGLLTGRMPQSMKPLRKITAEVAA